METINFYISLIFVLTSISIAFYSFVYRDKVYELRKKIPLPLSKSLSTVLQVNILTSWASAIIVIMVFLLLQFW